MGNILDTIKQQQDANNAEMMEKLQTVHKMMVDKIAATSAQMQNAAIEDKSLPIVTVVDKSQKYKIKVTNAPDQAISGAIGELMSGNFLSGLTSLITVALNQFLGNTSAGESEKIDFHVIYANNSLLRIDYMLYKYEFTSSGLKTQFQNAFCYYMQVAILDLEKVNPQVLLYELTRAIGEDNLPSAAEHLQSLAGFAKQLYSTVHQLKTAAITEGGSESGSSGGGTPPKPKPPNPSEDENVGREESLELSCKPAFEMFRPAFEEISREACDPKQEEYSRTEEFGVIVMEQEKSKIESS
ncbi:uncharacterized protein LOC144658827 [Oculina patagonica]